MHCITCEKRLPTNSYALVEGIYFCLPCFLEQYSGLPTATTACQKCDNTPSTSTRTTSDAKRETFGSTTSLSSTQSNKVSGAARRVGTAIARTFRQLRSPSPAPPVSIPDHQKPPRPSKTSQRTCQVCYDEKSLKHFRATFSHQCHQAERTICDACIYRHIQQSFQEMCTDDVLCPELQCGVKYDFETIKSILAVNKDEKLLERYERFRFHHQLEQMDEFIWCSNPKCQMGQLNDGGHSNNIVTCIYCHNKTCFIHRTPWHKGLTCEEFDSRTDCDLKESLKWLNQNTKTCPNCPYQIEKNDGCDHMTCIKCQYEFCWSCLADYDKIRREGNHRHHPNCKHYAAYPGH